MEITYGGKVADIIGFCLFWLKTIIILVENAKKQGYHGNNVGYNKLFTTNLQ